MGHTTVGMLLYKILWCNKAATCFWLKWDIRWLVCTLYLSAYHILNKIFTPGENQVYFGLPMSLTENLPIDKMLLVTFETRNF